MALTPAFQERVLRHHAELQQQFAHGAASSDVVVAHEPTSGEALHVSVLGTGSRARVEVRIESSASLPLRRIYWRDQFDGIASERLATVILDELAQLMLDQDIR